MSWVAWLGDKIWIWGAVALGIGFVIFVHELGHFLAAKLFGVKVEKFYVGFDVPIRIFGVRLPRTLGKFRWGETEYGIGVIPLGGYVKMLGQDDDPRRAAEERERIRKASGDADASAAEADGEETYQLDPRSYPAKSVWQRMVIISAGVVMNLITSVLFAAVAFGVGVTYVPAVIGQTVPGYPAWQAGLEPGGRVVSAGGIENDDQLHFSDMMLEVAKASIDDPKEPVPVAIRYGEEVRELSIVTASSPLDSNRRLIGVGPPLSNQLGESIAALPYSAAAEVLEEADRGARVVEVNGTPVETAAVVGTPLSSSITAPLVMNPAAPVELTLERAGGERVNVTVPPQPLKSLGFRLAPGPVTALVAGGPAEKAGVKVGDRIVGLGDDPQTPDAISLPQRIASATGPVQLRLERGGVEEGSQRETIAVEISRWEHSSGANPVSATSGQIELASIGLAYEPQPVIIDAGASAGGAAEDAEAAEGAEAADGEAADGEAADGEAADGEGLQAGDRIRRVVVLWPEDRVPETLEGLIDPKVIESLTKGWKIGPDRPLTALVDALQLVPTGTRVRLFAVRGEKEQVVEAVRELESSDDFWYERGLLLLPVQLKHEAESLGESFALGFRESKRKLGEVFSSLRMIFTGRVSREMIGGPVAIVSFAGTAASMGLPSLLLFLTFLSVNLAILNFLPIPALDGGHMVFLIAEAVRGKPVDEELQAKLTMAGVLALLSLMAFVFINDFINLSG
ncbi:site-2 protease family protein [Candidatus Laterigemmans baculatus]|uniref:site-2 protease family protein n=1 Tax=Candidatus Laterigemmans baculatus TaxID=2770505 RepID=UPI001F1D1D8F|nr:site-2 protease family protein [Candidatus Laterigemmans baculatus]